MTYKTNIGSLKLFTYDIRTLNSNYQGSVRDIIRDICHRYSINVRR